MEGANLNQVATQGAIGNLGVQQEINKVGVQSSLGNLGNQMAIQNNGLQNMLGQQNMQNQMAMQGMQNQMQMQGMQQGMMMNNMMNNMQSNNNAVQSANNAAAAQQMLMNKRMMEKMAPTPDLIEFGVFDINKFPGEFCLACWVPCIASHLISKSYGDSAGCIKYACCGAWANVCYSPGVTTKMNMKHGLNGETDQCLMHCLCEPCELGRELHYINLVKRNLVRSAVSDGPKRQGMDDKNMING